MAQIRVISMSPNDNDDLRSLLGNACDAVTINDVDADDVSGATFAEICL